MTKGGRTADVNDVLIFANPIAGRGRGRVLAERVAGRLAAEGFRPTLFLERPDQITREQLDAPAIAAIAIGGDGTVRSVARQLYQHEKKDKAIGPPLLIVPMGTANLLGKHLSLKWDDRHLPARVVAAIRTAVLKDRRLHVQAAAGIVADSDPRSEWMETQHKARALLRAAELADQATQN